MKLARTFLILALGLSNLHAEQMSTKYYALSTFCIATAVGAVAKAGYLLYKNSAARAIKQQFSPKLRLLKLCIIGHTAWDVARSRSRADLELFLNNDRNLLSAQNRTGQTLLTDAIESNCESIAHFLLERGACPNATNKVGRTPLSCAVRKGHEAAVRLLLERGANSNLSDKSDWNPLAHAIRGNNRGIMRVLLDHGAKLDSTSSEPLVWATKRGHAHLVQLFLEHGANPNLEDKDRWRPLSHAIKSAHGEIVQLLLSYGADLHDTNLHWQLLPLTLAASSCGQCQRENSRNARENIAHMLVSHGAEVTTEAMQRCSDALHDRLHQARNERFFVLHQGFATHNATQPLAALILQLSGQPTTYCDEYNQFCPLAWAASRRDAACVREALALMPLEKLQAEEGAKALFIAVKNGDEQITRMLLAAGINVNAQDEDGNTPLHVAIIEQVGQDLLRLLLEYAPNVDMVNNRGETSLYLAVSHMNTAAVEILLQNNADTEIEGQDEISPARQAIAMAKAGLPILRLLLQYGAYISADWHGACSTEQLHILAERNSGVDPQALKGMYYKDCIALIEATNERLVALKDFFEDWYAPAVLHTVILQLSDQADFRFERFQQCLLLQAALRGQAEEVSYQLSQGTIDPQSENCRLSLCMAAARGHDVVVQMLLNAGVKPDMLMSDASPLHWAACENRETTVQPLLNAGANIDIQNSQKQTPLHYAALTGHGAVIELLIARGAHINVQDNDHQTPLHKAVSNGHVRAARILLTSGADTSLTDSRGSTALHVAVRSDHPNTSDIIAIVQTLLEAGCNVNARDFYGQTALHHAVGDDRNECIISLLLRAGADPKVVDMHGNTSLTLAGNPLMRNLLLAWIRSREPLPLPLPLLLPLG